ncbi:MAG: molybdopterin molybdotransferase MoeA [Methylovulum sp.]|nr:molybdopterin molybdotransferase MoeA [Methylovulum sp.]
MRDVCGTDAKPMLSIKEALDRINLAITPVGETEIIALKHALGRVLADTQYSPINIPCARNAAMDGYAFASDGHLDGQAFTLHVAGTSWAGRPFDGCLERQSCVRIFTGAVVPEALDSVIMQEQIIVDGDAVHFPAHAPIRQNIRAAGEDVEQGGLLCAAPKKLTASDMGLLAAAGIAEITVKRRLNIAFFSTGDELTALGQPLQAGKIYDSNRYLLSGLLADACNTVVDGGVIADDKSLLEDILRQAAKDYDVIITTGGASVGAADYIKDVLACCGDVNFWKIAVKPGKPLAFGKIGACHFFGLPGNPVAVLVTFQQLVAPALQQLAGAPARKPLRFAATCTQPLKKAPGRQEFQNGILSQDHDGAFSVAASGPQGSHRLNSAHKANCYIILPIDCNGVKAGEQVIVEPFSTFI